MLPAARLRKSVARRSVPRLNRQVHAADPSWHTLDMERAMDGDRSDSSGRTVLLVEDDNEVRSLAARVLERAGYRVIATGWPEEAISIATTAGRLAALVTDVILPKMSGIAMASQLRERRPTLPILFMSGYPVEAIAGVTDFIAKPFKPTELVEAVVRVVGRANTG